jgi:DNA-binding IscR family transcriptional regulator
MSANSRFTTAVHALCWLELAARRGRHTLTSQEIAASLASHPVLVRRTLAPLRDAGIVTVAGRGPGAGWSLGRAAGFITLYDVYRVLGSETPFALHPHEPNGECPVGFGIRPVLTAVYQEVEMSIAGSLERKTIDDVLETILNERPLTVATE